MRPSHSAGLIELVVGDGDQLFERLDPTLVADRHLAENVERFIVHQAEDRPSAQYALVVRTPGVAISASDAAALAEGIRRHFAHRTREEGAKVHALVHDGRRDLTIGLVFLFICAVLGLFAVRVLPGAVGLFVEQGLLILGWVALWRPVDLFLYELRPLRLRRNLLIVLSSMDVRFEDAPQTTAG